ncbi:hypothetical protein Tco_0881783 [Tanacetum coccineum]
MTMRSTMISRSSPLLRFMHSRSAICFFSDQGRVLEVEGRAHENLYIHVYIKVMEGDMLNLIFTDESFDVVIKKGTIFSVSTDLSSVSHIDLQEPVSGIGTSKHQVTSSGHIGYSGHSSSANPIAANVTENVSGTVVGDHGVAVQCISLTRQFSQHSPRGDRNTSADVNIIGGVITPALSDGTSITVATDIAHDLPNDNSTSRENSSVRKHWCATRIYVSGSVRPDLSTLWRTLLSSTWEDKLNDTNVHGSICGILL